MTGFVAALRHWIKPRLPRFVLEPWQRRRFFDTPGWNNLHWGVFDSYQAALAYAGQWQAHTRFGAPHDEVLRKHTTLKAHDYPVLFWLAQALAATAGGRVVDLGGSVGVSYYAYRERLQLAPEWTWTVVELAEVAARGRAIAAQRAAIQLEFSERMEAIDGATILFSAGCLQYLEQPLADILQDLGSPPRHLVINRLALTEREAFVTLQNTGFSISPCRVDNVGQFVASLARLGYRQLDAWPCRDNHTEVPFHAECTLAHFMGFCFARD